MIGEPDVMVVSVTGASGLIGRATVAALRAHGFRVCGHAGPAHLRPPLPDKTDADGWPIADFVWGAITDESVLERSLDAATVVIHLAGPSSVAGSFADPVGAVAAHAAGTAAVVRAAALAGSVRRVVVASSAEVYGIPETPRVAEDHPLRPLSPYAAGKLGAEAVARSLAGPLCMELVLMRPFAVYGPGSPAWSLVGSAVTRAVHGGPVAMASLHRIRDLVYVDDAAEAFVAAATAVLSEPSLILNVCTGVGTTVSDLVRSALRAAGSEAEIIEAPPDPILGPAEILAGCRPAATDPPRLVGDPSRVAAELGWVAKTDLHAGLVDVVAGMRAKM